MKKTFLLSCLAFASIYNAHAQPPTLYNAITGVVWIDADSNNVRDVGEPLVPGILVTLVRTANDSVVSSSLTDAAGSFLLNNYMGTGTYYLNYVFPSVGYNVITRRAGSDNSINSAADSLTTGLLDDYTVSTPPFTIATNANLNTYGLGLHRVPTTLTYWGFQPMSPTSWSKTFRFPKSNNNIGLTNRASILITETAVHPTIGFENTGASPDAGSLEGSSRLTVTMPSGGGSMPQVNTSVVKNVSFGAYDGVTDYGGTSGSTWDSSYSAAHSFASITNGAQLTNAYRTAAPPDSFSITGSAVSFTGISGSANLIANISTYSGAGAFVTYVYPTVVALPIKLFSYTAQRSGKTAILRWQASSTAAGEGFVIERSTDAISFAAIGDVQASNKNGISSKYMFTDESPATGTNYYRLKMNHDNGHSEYSYVLPLSYDEKAAVTAAYPNPAHESVTVTAVAGSRIMLLNQLGMLVVAGDVQASGKTVLDVSELPTGVYTLKIVEPGTRNTVNQQVVVSHL